MSAVLYKLKFWENKRYVSQEDYDGEVFYRNEQDKYMCWTEKKDALRMKEKIERQYTRIGLHPPEICLEVYFVADQNTIIHRLPNDSWP